MNLPTSHVYPQAQEQVPHPVSAAETIRVLRDVVATLDEAAARCRPEYVEPITWVCVTAEHSATVIAALASTLGGASSPRMRTVTPGLNAVRPGPCRPVPPSCLCRWPMEPSGSAWLASSAAGTPFLITVRVPGAEPSEFVTLAPVDRLLPVDFRPVWASS